MSKSFSLAGMRVGYLVAPEALIAQFVKAKDSYNVNRLSIIAAAEALDDYDYMLSNVAKIKRTRAFLTETFTEMGFSILPSQANFIWAKAPAPGAKVIYEALKARRILVRFWDRPGWNDFLRISVGTRGQTDTLVAAVRETVGVKNAG
jgi:histidinol-phosphate aminotransferase